MSDNIPFEIQMEIVERIPDTKWVIRCRSVSKAWKSVIDSKEFVTGHTLRHQAHTRHLLIGIRDRGYSQVKYVSIVDDDDTFPHQKHDVLFPDSVDKFSNEYSVLLGSSHGLFCFYVPRKDTAVIWNPSIRKTVDVAVPNVFSQRHLSTVVGFGVCPRNLEPKLVKITYVSDLSRLRDADATTQVEVFMLSSGSTWRSPLSGNVPRESIEFEDSPQVIDGFIYWKAFKRTPKLIMSFDLTSEEFTKVNLPDCLALNPHPRPCLLLSNLRDSLAVLELEFNGEFNTYTERQITHVWMMNGHGCTRSFNKIYSINLTDTLICTTLGFRKSGELIVIVENDNKRYNYQYELAIHEPESNTNTKIGIHGLCFVHSYVETLLLLGH